MKKKSEFGLMIIWEKARFIQDKIINDVKKRFIIDNIFEIEWNKDIFSQNLSRFYGENLPNNSFKEKHCGNGKFILLILIDNNPQYAFRKTTSGSKMINVNFFDSKELYRKWSGNGHKIHATNDVIEFKHDLMMLLGLNIEDYKNKYKNANQIIKIKQDVVATDKWDSLEQVFYVLNETTNYVVLRNYHNLPESYIVGEHGDIDILCQKQYDLINILNAKKENKQKTRARYYININNNNVYFDLRFIGDKYYCKSWEKNILKNRTFEGKFYIPDKENYQYSLLYHALVHKLRISSDYLNIFNKFFKTNDMDKLKEKLLTYMKIHQYNFTDPYDISVMFNEKNVGKKMSIKKKIYFRFYFLHRIHNKLIRRLQNDKKSLF